MLSSINKRLLINLSKPSSNLFLQQNRQILYRKFTSQQNTNENNNNNTNNDNNNNNNNDNNKINENNNNNNNNNDKEHVSNSRTVTWASLIVALVSGSFGWLYYDHLMTKKRERQNEIKTYGTSSVGGPFALVDENGKPFTDLDLRGKYALLYFGFTYCPDVCPAELSKMTRVIKNLESNGLGDSIVPVFITIDPWRDTVEQVKSYIEEFHPKFKGLTGTPEQITKLAKYYRVFMSKAGKGDDYLVDHTIIVYLVGPNGKFIEFYNVNQDSDVITNKILTRIASGGKGGENKGEIKNEKSTFEKITELFK